MSHTCRHIPESAQLRRLSRKLSVPVFVVRRV